MCTETIISIYTTYHLILRMLMKEGDMVNLVLLIKYSVMCMCVLSHSVVTDSLPPHGM